MVPITTFTPASAQQNIQNKGLDALGVTSMLIGPRWSDTSPVVGNYDATKLTLALPGTLHAPFRGILEFVFESVETTVAVAINDSVTTLKVAAGTGKNFPAPTGGDVILLNLISTTGTKREVVKCNAIATDTFTISRGEEGTTAQAFSVGDRVELRLSSPLRTTDFFEVSGASFTGSAAVFHFHPQAVMRLERLAAVRFGNTFRPVPWYMVIRGATGFATPRVFEADESFGAITGDISFHDGRGLIIDPIAVAAMMTDLLNAFPALKLASIAATAAGPGGVSGIAGLASGNLIHFIEPHGAAYRSADPAALLATADSGGTETGTISGALITLGATNRLQPAAGDKGLLRFGWATEGILDRAPLTVPALPPPASLPRQFLRVCVVDTHWFLLGNRGTTIALDIGPDDGKIPLSLQPKVRDLVTIDYAVDGPDALAFSGQTLARLVGGSGFVVAVSPVLDNAVIPANTTGPGAHWPAHPLPDTASTLAAPPVSPATGIVANWSGANDVVVEVPSAAVPNGAHLRIFPRQFVPIAAIGPEPSFVRGDGGATIGDGVTPARVFLANPFNLAPADARPSPANLTMDIVVAPRRGDRRLWGNVAVAVGSSPPGPLTDTFLGAPTDLDLMAAMPANIKAVCPVPLFGMTRTIAPAGGAPSSPLDLVRRLASETAPREGPRLPTMCRFETIVTTGITNPAPTAAGTLLWDAVLTGGRWSRETRSAQHAKANPGNPAGPDLHAAGVHVTGALAYDLAKHALRRAQPILPVSGASLGFLANMGGNNFNEPLPGVAAQTGVGALLETVAAVCETPELSLLGITVPAEDADLTTVINNIASSLGIPAPSISVTNGNRLLNEARREYFVSKNGIRDALWSLRRAVDQARELVYIESPQFARTARPAGPPLPHEIDLTALLTARLREQPSLRVIICVPRLPDFAPKFGGWVRQAFRARLEAVNDLRAAAPDRVVVFHPVGFPGRPAYLRTTSVIVDDVWALSGTAHWRRRGMTFDGSASVVSFDRQYESGYSKKVREFRRQLMAAKLSFPAPDALNPLSPEWSRLARPRSAFEMIADMLSQGGLGRILPLWPGPDDTSVLPATDDMADPDGSDGTSFVTMFASLLSEAGS